MTGTSALNTPQGIAAATGLAIATDAVGVAR